MSTVATWSASFQGEISDMWPGHAKSPYSRDMCEKGGMESGAWQFIKEKVFL